MYGTYERDVSIRVKEKINYLINKFKNKNQKNIIDILKFYLLRETICMGNNCLCSK